jgi:hypothetical protein
MTRRMTAKPRLMRRKSSLRVSDGPVAPWEPLLLPESIAAKNAAGMVSAKTLPGLLSLRDLPTTKRVNSPNREERVVQLRAFRAELLFPYSGAASEERGTRDE